MVMAWGMLMSAIGLEVAATASLARTQGFRDPLWTVFVVVGYALSVWLLALVIKTISVSVAYAVWSGLGTAGIVAVGLLFMGEQMSVVKAGALAMIIAGVVVLNAQGAH